MTMTTRETLPSTKTIETMTEGSPDLILMSNQHILLSRKLIILKRKKTKKKMADKEDTTLELDFVV
jgi:hypothetical protein